MKLPIQPPNYDRSMEQQRSGILEREIAQKISDSPVDGKPYARKNGEWVSAREAVFDDDWDDLVVPGVAVNPPGAASDPTVNTSTGLLEFSGTADNVIIFSWQLPHGWSGAWDASMAIVIPHIHVRNLAASTNVSRWKFEYDAASVNGEFANAYGTFTTLATVSHTNPNNTKAHKIVAFGNLDLTGKGVSTVVHAKVSRLAASDGADTDTGAIALYSADLHIRRRRWGTDKEYTD